MSDFTPLEKYINHNGDEVVVASMPDKQLVVAYKFFQNYCSSLEDVLENRYAAQDATYVGYVSSVKHIRDSLLHEIKVVRKLTMSRILSKAE